VRVSASDANGVTRVELDVDGQPAQTLTTAPYEWTWETPTFDDGPHTLLARAYDEEGNVGTSSLIQVEVQNPFFFGVTNTTVTPMGVSVDGTAAVAVPSGQTYTVEYVGNPGSVHYAATTSGRNASGGLVGLVMEWVGDVDVRDSNHSDGVNLVVDASYAFLYVQNSGTQTLGPFVVNVGLTDQTLDDIYFPADGQRYTTGYYPAHTNTEIWAYWPNGTTITFWEQGFEFTFPFTQNQTVTLLNNPARTGTGTGTAPTGTLVSAVRAPAAAADAARPVIRGPHASTRTVVARAR